MRGTKVLERREQRAIHQVDTSLGLVGPRRLMTRDEAVKTLFALRESIDVPEADAEVYFIVDEAVRGFGPDLVVDRTRVLDPLLEIRSVLTRAQVAAV
jgi:hypothetical protein